MVIAYCQELQKIKRRNNIFYVYRDTQWMKPGCPEIILVVEIIPLFHREYACKNCIMDVFCGILWQKQFGGSKKNKKKKKVYSNIEMVKKVCDCSQMLLHILLPLHPWTYIWHSQMTGKWNSISIWKLSHTFITMLDWHSFSVWIFERFGNGRKLTLLI